MSVASRASRALGALLALSLAGALWLPNVHALYRPDSSRGPAPGPALAAEQVAAWSEGAHGPAGLAAMRAVNPEWDLMARTFTALGFADAALGDVHTRDAMLPALDRLVDDTLTIEARDGPRAFLLPYAESSPFVADGGRSLFVDGEIALILALRQLVAPRADLDAPLRLRTREIARAMSASSMRSGESYPDECWSFCNTTALAALAVSDAVTGESHDALAAAWVAVAKARLVDPTTGLLVASYTYSGDVKDGPEGSSLWMSARNLLLVDEPFARDQYARARRELGADLAGFAYAREWPRTRAGSTDIDSGTIVPWFEASPASSGLALLGARAFGDAAYSDGLWTSLAFAAQPEARHGRLRYVASNALGDAVILSAATFGPVWSRVGARAKAEAER